MPVYFPYRKQYPKHNVPYLNDLTDVTILDPKIIFIAQITDKINGYICANGFFHLPQKKMNFPQVIHIFMKVLQRKKACFTLFIFLYYSVEKHSTYGRRDSVVYAGYQGARRRTI
jgi:hypothetical protein